MADLWTLSASELARLVRTREASAREVAEAHLARIASVNPAINAVVQDCSAEALRDADAVDAAGHRVAGGARDGVGDVDGQRDR